EPMNKGSHPGPTPGRHVGGGTKDDTGHGDASQEPRDHVASTLRPEFPTGRRNSSVGIDAICRFERQRAFEACDNGQRQADRPKIWVCNRGKIRRSELTDKIWKRLGHW